MVDSWFKSAVVYHIYPRSFKDTNDDGIGDLKGIIQKLNYLNDLGISAIWLSPVYKSPMADFGYDVSDFLDIDPMFGSLQDFRKLVHEAHKRDIKVIMDYIPNHTSVLHPWFIKSRQSVKNPKRDWYIWKDPKPDGSPPNNWISDFGGSAWEFDRKTKQFFYHTFLKEQPDLNWRNPDVKKAMLDILRFWIGLGVDGFRIDAFNFLIKDCRFLDQPKNPNYRKGVDRPRSSLINIYAEGQPEMRKCLKDISKFLAKFPSQFMVTESYIDTDGLMKMYKCTSNKIHAPFNFHFIFLPWSAKEYKKSISYFESLLRKNDMPIYVLGNHDRPRVATRLKSKHRARIIAMLQLTLRGMPFIYYGEEIGMEDVRIPKNKLQDPLEKNMPGLNQNRDPARTPMQWNSDRYAGFSNRLPWLPIPLEYKKTNVEEELKDPKSILKLYQALIHLRKNSKALSKGEFRFLDTKTEDVLAYTRIWGREKILVVLNFSNEPKKIGISKKGTVILSSYLDIDNGKIVDLNIYPLRGDEGYVFSI